MRLSSGTNWLCGVSARRLTLKDKTVDHDRVDHLLYEARVVREGEGLESTRQGMRRCRSLLPRATRRGLFERWPGLEHDVSPTTSPSHLCSPPVLSRKHLFVCWCVAH